MNQQSNEIVSLDLIETNRYVGVLKWRKFKGNDHDKPRMKLMYCDNTFISIKKLDIRDKYYYVCRPFSESSRIKIEGECTSLLKAMEESEQKLKEFYDSFKHLGENVYAINRNE